MSVFINGQSVRALLDIEITYNFVLKDEAKCLSFKATKEGGIIKDVNCSDKLIAGSIQGVRVILRT